MKDELSCHIHNQTNNTYNQNKMFIPKILKKTSDWLNMTLNGSPLYVFCTLHVDFQTLHRRIPWMSTSKRHEDDGNHGGRKERVSGVVDCCWRQLFFNKFWLAIKRGEVQNLKGKNTVQKLENRMSPKI